MMGVELTDVAVGGGILAAILFLLRSYLGRGRKDQIEAAEADAEAARRVAEVARTHADELEAAAGEQDRRAEEVRDRVQAEQDDLAEPRAPRDTLDRLRREHRGGD